MSGKGFLKAASAAMALSILLTVSVSAHGGRHHARRAACLASCPVCTVEGCVQTGRHEHDGTLYCGGAHAGEYCAGVCPAAGAPRYGCR